METPKYPDPFRHLDKLTILIILIDILSIRTISDRSYYPRDYFDNPDSYGEYPNQYGDYIDPPGNYPDHPGYFPDHPDYLDDYPDYNDDYLIDCPEVF